MVGEEEVWWEWVRVWVWVELQVVWEWGWEQVPLREGHLSVEWWQHL